MPWRLSRPRFRGALAAVAALLLAALVVIIAVDFESVGRMAWDWLSGTDSNATTLRNILLGIGGPLAVAIAWRRSSVSQRTLLNERYQKGAEMLGNEVMAVRLGGIYALGELARERPKSYHVQVLKLFCAYVRAPTPVSRTGVDDPTKDGLMRLARQDIQEVMDWIGRRGGNQRQLESAGILNLVQADLSGIIVPRGANLAGALLAQANLTRSSFTNANLAGALFYGASLASAFLEDANLSEADLREANLRGASLNGATLSGAQLSGAQLSGADLSGTEFNDIGGRNPAKGLTQAQLNKATTQQNSPPRLSRVVNKNGRQLVWRKTAAKKQGSKRSPERIKIEQTHPEPAPVAQN